MDNNKYKHFYSIGLMSGTSCDGIDASLIETDGINFCNILDSYSSKYTIDFQNELLEFASNKVGDYLSLEYRLTVEHIKCVEIIKSRNINIKIDVIGFHGQTIEHRPDIFSTWQMGNPILLSKACKIDVIFDFRKRDMVHNGQGAPLIPIYHALIAKKNKIEYPVVFLNLGGIANITYIYQDILIAGDVGPGNCLIDDWVKLFFTGNQYDVDGTISKNGIVQFNILDALLDNVFYTTNFPKSLDRMHLSHKNFDHLRNANISPQDGLATLVFLTAICVKIGIQRLEQKHIPETIFVCGGGRKNKTMINQISDLCNINTKTIETLSEDGDILEATAFAYLAVRSILNLPVTFSSTTGVDKPTSCGILHKYIETKTDLVKSNISNTR